MEIFIGQKVKHKEVNDGHEILEVVGLKKGEVLLLKTDTQKKSWLPIKGLITKNIWGNWIDPDDDFFERITKNAGPRD